MRLTTDIRIADSSSLILLAKAGLAYLLPTGRYRLVVPEAVLGEIDAGGPDDPARAVVREMLGAGDIALEAAPIPLSVSGLSLGVGETAVLATALLYQAQGLAVAAVLDDRQARRAASGLGVPVVGIVGVLLQAKEDGLIDSFRASLHALVDAGMWLDDVFCRRVSLSAAEEWP